MRRGFPNALTVLVLAGVFAGAWAIPAGAQTAKIGFVNIQRIVVGSKRGKEVLAKLQAEKDAKQREIEAEEQKIRQMETDLEKQASVLSDAARKERERTIRDRQRALRRTVEDLNRSFSERERDIQQQLLREVTAVVNAYGKEKGYFLIIEGVRAGIMYHNEAADLTDEVIAAYDASRR
ncbi:MAG: OmpH family outer membrane protein [Candidatus Methylomirabilales bacterium]